MSCHQCVSTQRAPRPKDRVASCCLIVDHYRVNERKMISVVAALAAALISVLYAAHAAAHVSPQIAAHVTAHNAAHVAAVFWDRSLSGVPTWSR
jgi:hypothetical protein